MIHSLAGGELRTSQIITVAKLEFEENKGQFFWYLCGNDVNVGDIVFAPFGPIDQPQKAKVIKVEKNIDSKNFPISTKRLKRII